MSAARLLRYARHKAGLTQRQLATRAGMSQPTVARIESGAVSPRLDTLDHLLSECGVRLTIERRPGAGIDRSAIRELLALTPTERLELAAAEANALEVLR